MREVVKVSGFILLIIGTLGLLVSEFAFDGGRAVTLTFAVFNGAGLALLAITERCEKRT